jgi:hypothetical protein
MWRRSGLLAVVVLCGAVARAETLAIMPVKLLDTSGEATDQRTDHERRLALVEGALADDLQGSGRYRATIPVAPQAIAAACPRETAACLIGAARDAGGDAALFVVVQKTSTLILQVFAHVVDTRTNALLASRDLNFRGDTDAAWLRMERFLAEQLADATSDAPRR